MNITNIMQYLACLYICLNNNQQDEKYKRFNNYQQESHYSLL